MKKFIVLDKSFLQGAPKSRIESLGELYGLLMPEEMLYEMVKAHPADRAKFFMKFPSTARPFELSKNLGSLLRYEKENLRSCGLPSQQIRNIDHAPTKDYQNPEYVLPDELTTQRESRKSQVDEDVERLVWMTENIGDIFPETRETAPKDRENQRNSLQIKTFTDSTFLKQILKEILPLPGSSSTIDHTWISYRWLQVNMLFALDYWVRYPQGIDLSTESKLKERIRHDALDAGILIVGLQEGALATKEKKLINWWEGIYPEGLLLEA
ncbi:hypothetical protein [Pseudomonas urmiensis]|uniref:hypothetical protein n=1 Tax=Pseudomonas urmiensis TaxID=2745493 RepID=UPI003CBFBD6A